MPTKLRNIIFIIICICALSIAFIYQGAKWAHVLPASFNNGTYSYLEGAKLQTRPKVTLANNIGILDKSNFSDWNPQLIWSPTQWIMNTQTKNSLPN